MKHRTKIPLIASACLVLSLVASSIVLHRIDQLRPQATLDEVLFLNSPKVIKRASLGFDGLVACIYWTRAVQYFGSRFRNGAPNYNLLAPLLEITTQLDPHLVVAYDFGSTFLASKQYGAGEPQRAIELMNYGIKNNPDDWRLYYDLGFIYYMELKDYKNAADAFERGSRVPNAHPFVKILAALMAQHAGGYQTSRMLWSATFQTTNDSQVKKNAVEHLRDLRVDEDVQQLQDGVTRFEERTERLPASMAELLASMGQAQAPVDPDGQPYKLMPDGRVEVRVPDDFPFATKGLPPGYKPSPKFHSQP
jgi:tetratricopeptide (TPR) repeat protein